MNTPVHEGRDRVSLAEQEACWRQTLTGRLPVFGFHDQPRPPVQSFLRERVVVELDEGTIHKARQLALKEGTTPCVPLLSAFMALLSRYTAEEDIVVGSLFPDCIRVTDEFGAEAFTNPVALRADLRGDPEFRTLLHRVAAVLDQAAAHRDYPFQAIVRLTDEKPDPGRSPVFQTMWVVQDEAQCAGVRPLTPQELDEAAEQTTRCDLVLVVLAGQQPMSVVCEYDAALFEPGTIQRLLSHFQILLAGAAADPSCRLSRLPLLSPAERRQLLVDWSSAGQKRCTVSGEPASDCVPQLFEAQVERTPDGVAVIHGDRQWTYRELNARANQLAHFLHGRGVGAEALVGLCVERSLEMLVGMLGILKAGAAYVPLDPAYPRERLAFMLEDARVSLLLTTSGVRNSNRDGQVRQDGPGSPVPTGYPVDPVHPCSNAGRLTVVCLDSDWPVIARESRENPASGAAEENLAYVIYTSGSTGRPKGVMIQHGGLTNLCHFFGVECELRPEDRLLQFASHSFDTSVEEIFPSLTRGATLVLRSEEMLVTPSRFLQRCGEWGISGLNLPTAYWHVLTEGLDGVAPGLPSCLRLVIIGGERALPERWAAWRRYAGGRARLVNCYGPTESTVLATLRDLTEESSGSPAREVPIGRPITNLQSYVLDHSMQPVPVGVPGELYLGGEGLARGYLNRPELTAERFLPHPFSREPGARLYRTGDVVRYRSDGNLEFVGRVDEQVKLHGFRVELGEIEAALRQHAAVAQCAVLAREEEPGDSRLVAYVVPTSGVQDGQSASPTPERLNATLRLFLQQKLPEYMVPSSFVLLEALPLTPNGKVDRRALPAPDASRPELETRFVAPRSPVEEGLAAIWAGLLGRVPVGIHDNFFELGGHSLLATQLIARMQRIFDVELPLRRLFEAPTIAGLAALITESLAERAGPMEVTELLAELDRLSEQRMAASPTSEDG